MKLPKDPNFLFQSKQKSIRQETKAFSEKNPKPGASRKSFARASIRGKRAAKKRKDWNFEEEQRLVDFIKAQGPSSWKKCAAVVGTRTAKQCKEKWNTSINPRITKGFWSRREQLQIFTLMRGGELSWTRIQAALPSRTNVTIRNFVFNSFKKIRRSKFYWIFTRASEENAQGTKIFKNLIMSTESLRAVVKCPEEFQISKA